MGTPRVAPFLSLIAAAALAVPAAASDRVLWFAAPAAKFTEACPLGNGRLGATVFGGVPEERIVLNETGMWSGSSQDADRKDAAAALPEIRRLLLAGRNVEAEKLVNERFTCAGKGTGFGSAAHLPYGCYQVLGNLHLRFVGPSAGLAPSGYRRELDLGDAVARVRYEQGGVHYTREVFVSAPAQLIVVRLTADRPGSLSFDVAVDRPEAARTSARGSDRLLMTGRLDNGVDGRGVRFAAEVRVEPRGGSVRAGSDSLQVRGASEALLEIAAATDIKTFAGRSDSDPAAAVESDLARAAGRRYDGLLRDHLADYRSWFDRADLSLGPDRRAGLPLPERLRAFHRSPDDPALAALYFDFGRYLLISCSRPGGLPSNLQGLWTDQIQTPWNCDWHLNINLQMNYWPAEVCGLSELTQPLFALISSLQEPGARTARAYYGAHGWVVHVVTNPWGFTSPGESASWGATSTCSAWLCQHLWDHYLFTEDRSFLAWAYPIMKGSALFYLDMLIREPGHGWLVTAPSNSPENSFYLHGEVVHICLGATADEQLLRYLFGACIDASRILGVDAGLRSRLEAARRGLAPTRIGPDGRVLEWLEPYREVDPHHRHTAHLWGLYPGDEISPSATPALAAAARKTLLARGDAGTGWSLAYRMALWARLHDGKEAFQLLRNHLKPADPGAAQWSGGTYPDFLDAHPPFQIDGNFGGAAAIAEMLLQSRPGEIELLPALPPAWPDGSVRGFRARGGCVVDFAWRAGRLASATLHPRLPGRVLLTYAGRSVPLDLAAGQSVRVSGQLHLIGP